MSSLCVIILAAGEGKRMKSSLPKVMHQVGGKPMVNHVIDAARDLRASKTIVVVARKRLEVRQVLDRGVCSVIQGKQLGTADAVRVALKEIPSQAKDVMVLYGDTPLITEATVRALLEAHHAKDSTCTVLTTYLNNPKGYGRMLRNDSGLVMGIIEDKEATMAQKSIREINTGMYVFKKEDLLEGLQHVTVSPATGEYYLTDVVSRIFNKNKRVEAYVAENSDEVLGVNTPAELLEAGRIIRMRICEKHAENGVTIMDPATTFIDPAAIIAEGTVIFPFTYIENNVSIGRKCSLGPFCHLREGAVLKDGCSIGNYTEIKNSTLGAGTFMRHMSYLGDTVVGESVNIGAGAVVANFDGKKKHRTVIKDKVFIGCDAVLVAPVVIGKNAVVGAGSVVTKNHNVGDGETVVGVPAKPLIMAKPKTRSKKG
jgi:bifunctional UDP-N-acetylglucosamine pyrophosphorylase / glucosamine-1-phosphate N-acetyltransferase